MIRPEDCVLQFKGRNQGAEFPHRLNFRKLPEASGQDPALKGSVWNGKKSQAGDKSWLHEVEGPGCFCNMKVGELLPAESDQSHDGEAKPGLLGSDAAIDRLLHRSTLAHGMEDFVRPAFQTEIEGVQPFVSQRCELTVGFGCQGLA